MWQISDCILIWISFLYPFVNKPELYREYLANAIKQNQLLVP